MYIKIGYQGVEGSNSEYAAIKISEFNKIKNVHFIPLETSMNVVKALLNKEIDYGVLAYENNIAGLVSETIEALSLIKYDKIISYDMPIHHSLFVYNEDISSSKITKIASHEQALSQCKNYINNNFPNITLIKDKDTAISAQRLKDGFFDLNTAIICKREAGEKRNLYLLANNIEDRKSITNFILIKKI